MSDKPAPFFTAEDFSLYPDIRVETAVVTANAKVAPLVEENARLKYEAEARVVLYDERLEVSNKRIAELEKALALIVEPCGSIEDAGTISALQRIARAALEKK